MRKFVKFAKRVIAMTLIMAMMVSLFQSDMLRTFADAEETAETTTTPVLDFVSKDDEIAEIISAVGQTATIKETTVNIYKDVYYGAPGMGITVAEGTVINLVQALKFPSGAVLYYYEYLDKENTANAELYEYSFDYKYISADDIIVSSGDAESGATPTPTPTPEVIVTPTPDATEEPEETSTTSPEATATPTKQPAASMEPTTVSEYILDTVPAGAVANSTDVQGAIAIISTTPVVVYKSLDNGAEGVAIEVETGIEIQLVTKYTFIIDETQLVFYRYDYTGANEDLANAAVSEISGYPFISADYLILKDDIGFEGDTITETTLVDIVNNTGVTASGVFSEDVTLSVIPRTIAESGVNAEIYPINESSLFFDVTLYDATNAETQPTDGITITIPEATITSVGIQYGDYYHTYHIHDGVVDMGELTQYKGGNLDLIFESLSIIGIGKATAVEKNLIAQHGIITAKETLSSYLTLTFNKDSVILYDTPEDSNAYTTTITGAIGVEVEAWQKITYNDGFIVYRIGTTANTPSELSNVVTAYPIVSADDTAIAGEETDTSFEDVTVETPDEYEVVIDYVSNDSYKAVKKGLVTISEFRDWEDMYLFGYDISIVNEEGTVYQPITEEEKVTVSIAGAWDTTWDFPIVEVYHILENEAAITAAINNGTIRWCTASEVVASYGDIVQSVDGILAVPYVVLSTANGLVTLHEDGSISFETDSFSDYYIMSSDGQMIDVDGTYAYNTTGLTYNVYMLAGTETTLRVSATSGITFNGHNNYVENAAGVKVSEGVVGTDSTNYTVSVSSTASTSNSVAASYSFAFTQSGTTYNATINVCVFSESDSQAALQTAYTNNTVSHIQLNVDTVIVMINGIAVDSLTDLNMHYTSANAGTPTKMEDTDSLVGYYYIYTYETEVTYNGADGNSTTENIETNISIRIDETSLPSFMFDENGAIVDEYLEALKKWSFSAVGIDSSQNQISFAGTVPVGTMQYPVKYIITVETTYTGANTTYVGDEMTFTDTIGFWDLDNVCPGVGNGEGNMYSEEKVAAWQSGEISTQNPGIDVAKFSTGYTDAEGNSYYVIYNDLTKVVHNFDFKSSSTVNSRTYAFTIYRRPEGSTDESAWVAVDTISATVSANDKQTDDTYKLVTSLNTSADKYYGYLTGYDYKIVETGYSIAGYDCDTKFTINGTTGSGNSALFDWTVNELLTYSYESGPSTETNGSTTTITYTYTKDTNGNVTLQTVTSNVLTETSTSNTNGGDSSTTTTTTNDDGSVTTTTTEITYTRNGGNKPEHNGGSSTTYTKTTVTTTVTTKTETLAAFPGDFVTAADKTYVYYAEIQCDNTYSQLQAGMTIEKKLTYTGTDGPVADSDDYFQVTITPTSLSSENGRADFNGKSFSYTINGAGTYTTTATSPDSGYGSITIYVRSGEVINFTSLPVGTFTVKETAGVYYTDSTGSTAVTDVETTTDGETSSARYTYDTTTYTRTLTSGVGVKVTLNNTTIEPEVTINYRIVDPDGKVYETNQTCGTLTSFNETVKVSNGTATGSSASAGAKYNFVGWYSDEACQNLLSTDVAYVPVKPEYGWVDGTTYYAKFELSTTSLTIQKNVIPANGYGIPNTEFEFKVTITGAAGQLTYTLGENVTEYNISNGGTIKLSHAQTAVFKEIPVGASYEVVETENTDYETESTDASGTIAASGSTAVFTNTQQNTAALEITKNVNHAAGFDVSKEEFEFKVEIENAASETELYYTIGTAKSGSIKNGGTITLKDGETAVFNNLAAGVGYKVTETADDAYKTESENASGTLTADSTAKVVFTNTQKTASLTIGKEAGENTTFEIGETFIFYVTGPNGYENEVVIAVEDDGNGNPTWSGVTITNLPYGEYTVTEDTAWSYRYNVDSVQKAAQLGENSEGNVIDGSVTFTNTVKSDNKWLTSDAYAENIFVGVSNTITTNN